MKSKMASILISLLMLTNIFGAIAQNAGEPSSNPIMGLPLPNISVSNPQKTGQPSSSLSGSGGLADSPWPMFGHNLRHTCLSPYDTSGNNGKLKWSFMTGGRILVSSPAIGSDGTIYVGSLDCNLYAINPNGSEKWHFTTGDQVLSSPAIALDGTIYVGSQDKKLYAINPDGTKKWSFTTGDVISSSPAIGIDGTIYIGSSDNKMYAINPDGTKKWSFTSGGDFRSSPAIDSNGTIYVGSHDNKLYAIKPDGTEKWSFSAGYHVCGSPAIGFDGTIYVGSMDNKLYAINPDGTKKWSFTIGGVGYLSPAIDSKGTIYIGSHYHKLFAFNPNGTQKWNFTTGGGIESSPAIGSDGTIYIGSFDYKFYAINPDGTEKWRFKTDWLVHSSPSISSDGTIYIGSFDNKLYAIGTLSGLQVNVTSHFSELNSAAQSSITVHVTEGTNPVQVATVNLVSDNGGIFSPQSGITDANGDFKSIFNAPTVTSQIICRISAEAGKTGYNNGSGYVDVTVNPIPWPMFSHNCRRTGLSPYDTSTNPGKLKWSFMTGLWVESSPAIGFDGTIYIGSCDNKLYAIYPEGIEKWNFTTGVGIHESSPVISSDGTIFVGSYDNNLYAINPDGTERWKFTTGWAILSSPAIGPNGTIYVGSDDHKLYAINQDGTEKWSFETGYIIWSSPAIGSDGTIYIGSQDNKLYAINPDGTEKWNFLTGGWVVSSPAIGSDGIIYVGSHDDKIYAIKPDGTEKWSFMTSWNVGSSPAIGADGTIYVGSWDGKLYAINPVGTEKWNFETGGLNWSSPAIGSDGTIYIGSDDYKLYAINPDGSEKWNFTTNDRVKSSPAIGSDGTIYVGSNDHKLYAIGAPTQIQPPIADAGPNQIINEGEKAFFNVSGSYDPDGYLVRYEFDFGDGTNYTWEPSLTGIGGKDILVYVTQAHGAYNRTWFDYDLPRVLAEEGFNVNVTGLDQIDEITSGLLSNYDQLWIFSTNFSSTGVFSSSEIDTILNFHDNGGGLLIMADHTYGSASTATDANQISTNYGVTFSGFINHGHKEIDPFIVDHPLNENVDTIWGHWSEADLTVTNPDVEVIAVHSGYEMIAVYDVEDEGRIVFDTSVTRMEDGGDPNGHDILKGDNVQYAKNIAKWLGKGFAPEPPPLINHTYGDDGVYTVTLKITDETSSTDTDICNITVNNVEPTLDTKISQNLTKEWIARYNAGNYGDWANAITVGPSGNIYVTGHSYIGYDSDYATVAYDPLGNELWVARYDGPAGPCSDPYGDYPYDIVVDSSENIYVTGKSRSTGCPYDYGEGQDIATVAYDPDGNQLWVAKYNGPGNGRDTASAMVLSPNGNIIVTGESRGIGTDADFATIAYDFLGNQLWIARYNGPGNGIDEAWDIVVDEVTGNIYVTGRSTGLNGKYDYATVAYDSNGNELWIMRYDGLASLTDEAMAMEIDSSGIIYVTGSSDGVPSYNTDITTIAYDSNGTQLWVARSDAGSMNENAYDIAVDNSGRIYVTGRGRFGSDSEYLTVGYDLFGNLLWTARYDGAPNHSDSAIAIAVVPQGFIFVTGWSNPQYPNYSDYATIIYDSDGNELFVSRYNGLGSDSDSARAITVDPLGNVYVTGGSKGIGTGTDYATIKYSPLSHYECSEGSPVTFTMNATDPGSDDLTFIWNWGDGTPDAVTTYYNDGTDPEPVYDPNTNEIKSPWGTYPFNATDTISHIYGDNGVYTITLTVEDDDGGVITCQLNVTVNNVKPEIQPFGPFTIDESSTLDMTGIASDPGSDDLTFTWTFEYGPTITNVYYNDGTGPDPYPSPGGIFPFSATDTVSQTYGDDGNFNLTLKVEDDDGGISVYKTYITVSNVNPTVVIKSITMDVEIGLRVAGRKYNNVSMALYEGGNPIGYVSIERLPGSPNEQMAWIPVSINFSKSYSATVTYTPEDPPNVGGNPVWIYLKSKDSTINKIHHTFNVQQSKKRDSDHWNHVEPWEVDLSDHFIGLPFEITSHITDPGSDDETLTFTYGSQVKTVTYLNNPPNPDPFPSPEVKPMDIMDTTTLIYEGLGTVTLVVRDDDNIRLGVGQGSDFLNLM